MGRWPKCPRSAYSASPPVTTRNTAPSTTNPRRTSSAKKCAAWYGETAASTEGSRMIWLRPSTPIVANQTSITGPNTAPIRAVPRLCTRNKPIRITSVTGITHGASAGVAISSPSTAESTEIAGVRPPSAYKSADPKIPSHTAAVDEGHQGEHAAFALVVRPDDHDVVLDRDDDHEGPEHEREYAEHVARCDRDAVRSRERIADRVQWARSDVAVHDAQRREGERDEIAAVRLLGND